MKNRSWIVATAALLCVLCAGLAYGVSNGEKVKMTGLITGRNGDTLTVRTLESGNIVVVLTDNTKVVQPKGALKIRKTDMGVTALIPGLKVQVDGMGDPQNRVVAKRHQVLQRRFETGRGDPGWFGTDATAGSDQPARTFRPTRRELLPTRSRSQPIKEPLGPTSNRLPLIRRTSTSAFPNCRTMTPRGLQPSTSPLEAPQFPRRIKPL